MAEVIGVASGLTALVSFSFQSSKSLYTTIASFKNHPKAVRELKAELQALSDVLEALKETVEGSTESEFASLKPPLHQCGTACEEFKATLKKCTQNSDESRRSFRDWAKLKFRDGDINGFKDMLARHKSTITIALCGANLRATSVNLKLLNEYSELIRDTKTDLEDRLDDLDDMLTKVSSRHSQRDMPVELASIQQERDSTVQCLEICAQVSAYIEQRQHAIVEDKKTAAVRNGSRQKTTSTLQECKEKLDSTDTELSARLQLLGSGLEAVRSGSFTPDAVEKMKEELEIIQQSLQICGQAESDADKLRMNIAEDIQVAEDGQQIFVSTIGDLISARRVTAGARSLQCFGQMSDDSVQQVSRARSQAFTNTLASSPSIRPTGFESQYGVGHNLKPTS